MLSVPYMGSTQMNDTTGPIYNPKVNNLGLKLYGLLVKKVYWDVLLKKKYSTKF